MKKVLLLTVAALLVLSIFAGCANNAPAASSSPAASESPSVTASESPSVSPSETASVSESTSPSAAADEILSTGPNGEKATPATTLSLTDAEIAKVKEGKYKAAICFHYGGNDWSSAQLKGLKDTFANLGIEVVAVTDANFKAEQQVTDIESATALNPNVIVSIPTDPVATSSAYLKAASKGIKLVFMDNCPANMTAGKDYVSVVSADNYGNGVKAADIMAENLGSKGKIGVIFYDADFFVTNQRVEAFEKTIADKYPDIQIVDKAGFQDPNKVTEVADAMLTKNKDLNGIFAVWDVPAEAVVAAAKAAGRTDLVITTIDLGNNVARMIAEGGMVKGLGAQLPYDQGVAEATLAAYSLLGKDAPPYVAVPALKVTKDNILEAYKTVYHVDAPADIQKAAGK